MCHVVRLTHTTKHYKSESAYLNALGKFGLTLIDKRKSKLLWSTIKWGEN